MQRLSLDDVLVIVTALAPVPQEDHKRFCLDVFSKRHVHHKIAKRLGTVHARDLAPKLPQWLGASDFPRVGVSNFRGEFLSFFSALDDWKRAQARRGGARER